MLLNEMLFEQVLRDRKRELASRLRVPQVQREPQPIRRAIGRSIIAIGVRLAAEPQPRLAQSR
jgi:hypothetical protein